MDQSSVVVAGVTGNLGERIVLALHKRGAAVRGLVRQGTAPAKIARLQTLGVTVVEVDFKDVAQMAQACSGAACVISALAGLGRVILDAQTVLLDGAVQARVPRFIPSDYSIDLTKLPVGSNRNLDLRREFHARLATRPIAATSIFNGAFTDMLTGQDPFILFKLRRVLAWGNPDQAMSFTTVDDTAEFTAAAALDSSAPRFLHIAGDQISARGLVAVMDGVSGKKFKLFRPGGLGLLAAIIKFTRAVMPESEDLYPPWQGMQYMHNMFSGRALPERLDNDRYGARPWTTARDVLVAH